MVRGAFDLVLVALASTMSVIAALAVSTPADLPLRAASAGLYASILVMLLLLVSRLELALYALVPLMTAVRIEPAPVDFLAAGLLVAIVVRGQFSTIRPLKVVTVAITLLLASYIGPLLIAPDPDLALRYTSATLLMVGIGYVAFRLGANNPQIVERAYVLAAVLLGIETIIAALPVPAANLFLWLGFRADGLFKDPNVFGAFALPAVSLLLLGRPAMPLVLRLAALAFVIAPAPASQSRGAVLAVVVSVTVLGAVAAFRRWRHVTSYALGVLTLGALAVFALIAFGGSGFAVRRFTSLVLESYDAERFAGQLAGLSFLLQHPLSFGVGPGNYEIVLGHASHETYLRMLVETGPASLIALVLLIWAGVRFIRSHDPATVAWVVALIGFAASGLFIDTLHWRHMWLVLAMPFAIAAHRGRQPGGGTIMKGRTEELAGSPPG
jgi:hypothetical protein